LDLSKLIHTDLALTIHFAKCARRAFRHTATVATLRLDRIAKLYALRETTGDAGSPRRVFYPPVSIWVGRLRARASLPADSQGGRRVDAETLFAARYCTAIAAGARLIVDGQTYEITSAIEVPPPAQRFQQMHVTCHALVGAQPIPTE